MAEKVFLSVSSLLLDVENFRLGVLENQIEVINHMFKDQGEKIIRLAEDIAANGLSPLEVIGVVADENSPDQYYVVEGNRRILALKLLANPNLLDKSFLSKFKNRIFPASKMFLAAPIMEIECTVFPSREDSYPWMSLKHTGENEGKGVVQWSTEARSRLTSQLGARSDDFLALCLLDYLRKSGITIDQNYPVTNLSRLLTTPHVRKKLGIIETNPNPVSICPHHIFLPLIEQIAADLSQAGAVNRIRYLADRISYINDFDIHSFSPVKPWNIQTYDPGREKSPTHSSATTTSVINRDEVIPSGKDGSPSSQIGTSENPAPPTKIRSLPLSSKRSTLIPSSFSVKIEKPKVNAIFRELKSLKVDSFPNATAVLLRVFLELSIDHFGQKRGLDFTTNDKLNKKVQHSAEYMKNAKIMTEKQLVPIFTFVSDNKSFLSSASFNAYVHNLDYAPIGREILNNTWDDLQPFFEKLWE